MDGMIKRLAEIEETAEAIVASAEEQKFEVEKEIQKKRDEFDRQLNEETARRLEEIRAEGQKKVDKALEEEYAKNHSAIDRLEADFAQHHAEYAEEILRHITEV